MTLQPYDGANRVLLPDGRECWEKKVHFHFGGSETTYSYQYSVEIGDLSTDYYGRVIDLKVQAPDGSWNEIVTFLPVSLTLVKKLRATMEQGWELLSDTVEGRRLMWSHNYLRVMEDVLALLQSGVKS